MLFFYKTRKTTSSPIPRQHRPSFHRPSLSFRAPQLTSLYPALSHALSGLLIYRPAFAAKQLRQRRRHWRRRRLLNEILNFSALANSRDKAIALYDCSYAAERERETDEYTYTLYSDPIDRWLLNKNKNDLDKYVYIKTEFQHTWQFTGVAFTHINT